MQLEDVRIIVTGAAKGIGRATAEAFLDEGARVAVLDVIEQPRDAARGAECALRCDVSSKSQVDHAIDEAVAKLGRLDVLVHAAAILGLGPAESLSAEDWDTVLRINVMGTVFTNQAAFRHMKARGGRIVNFGSGGGVRGQMGSAHYAASKGAVHAFTRTAAQEWGGYGITVNAVAPAAWTGMYDDYLAVMPEEVRARFLDGVKERMPIGGKLGDPRRDIAPVMVFLASPAAHFITGQVIPVDGGMVMLGS